MDKEIHQNDIHHDTEQHRFSVVVEGKEALLDYSPQGDSTLNYNHTFVPPELRGKGVASVLAKAALDYAKENGYTVIPSCSFVAAYVRRHREYDDIIEE